MSSGRNNVAATSLEFKTSSKEIFCRIIQNNWTCVAIKVILHLLNIFWVCFMNDTYILGSRLWSVSNVVRKIDSLDSLVGCINSIDLIPVSLSAVNKFVHKLADRPVAEPGGPQRG